MIEMKQCFTQVISQCMLACIFFDTEDQIRNNILQDIPVIKSVYTIFIIIIIIVYLPGQNGVFFLPQEPWDRNHRWNIPLKAYLDVRKFAPLEDVDLWDSCAASRAVSPKVCHLHCPTLQSSTRRA